MNYHDRAMELFHASDLNGYHAGLAASFHDPKNQSVLVVGCSRGDDCRYFVDFGAASVVGVDIEPEIGINFSDPRVIYKCESVEQLSFPEGTFDIVFSFATLEHVHNIQAAYPEMVRVLRPGGTIYCHASPLWNSRQGPHWGDSFSDVPWAHLRKTRLEIQEMNKVLSKHSWDQIDYFLHDEPFNKRWAREYLAATSSIPGIEVLRNEITMESDDGVPPEVIQDLAAKGYSRQELFGQSHTFIARKITQVR